MKGLLLAVAALVAAVHGHEYEPITLDYHETIGIPEAARIKQAEEAADFDGTRIVGGSAAALGQFPYLGGMVITLASGATSVCGSSLLTNTRLVTAAHCWISGGVSARQAVIVLASVRLFSGGTRITTSNVQVHGSYNSGNLNNDVAVITISWVTFNNNIQPIPLANANIGTLAGSWVSAAGFGRTSDSAGITTNQFMSHVNVQVITNAVCAQTYGNSAVIASTLCTSAANGQGTCGGDSGGPIALGSGNSRTLVGIVSFGALRGCQFGFPNGHARVSSFVSWIQARL